MLACLNDWFHGERKHMEERRARQSRQVGGHQTHTRERIIHPRGAWRSMNKSCSIRLSRGSLFLLCLWWPLITNRALRNLYAPDVTASVLFHRYDGIDVYRTDIGVELVRRMHSPYFIGGPVPILRDSALAKGRSVATLPHRLPTQSIRWF